MKKFIFILLLFSLCFIKDCRAGYIMSKREERAFEQGWFIPICSSVNICGEYQGGCSISKPTKEQIEELLIICQTKETGESRIQGSPEEIKNKCLQILDEYVNKYSCPNIKNIVVTQINGKTVARPKTHEELIGEGLITPVPTVSISIDAILSPQVTKTPDNLLSTTTPNTNNHSSIFILFKKFLLTDIKTTLFGTVLVSLIISTISIFVYHKIFRKK